MKVKVQFKKLKAGARTPVRKTGNACYDIYIPETVIIKSGTSVKVGLGFAMKLPEGYHAKIYMRSSSWDKYGVFLTNEVGIIDNTYNGNGDEWIISLYKKNSDGNSITLMAGARVAQFEIVHDCPDVEFEIVDELESKDRGGFGSTGE